MGRQVALFGLLATAVLGASTAGPAEVVPQVVEVQVRADLAATAGELILEPRGNPEPEGQTTTLSVQVPGTARLSLARESMWRLRLVGEGVWAAPCDFAVGTQPKKVAVHAFPSAVLRGTLVAPKGFDLPATVTAHMTPPPGLQREAKRAKTALPQGEQRCPVEASGRFLCALPVGRHDLRILAPGFATEYRWDVEVAPKPLAELGTLRLRPGGSLIGSVVAASGISPRQAWVELEPLTQTADTEELRLRLRSLKRSAALDDRGFFQLTGLPPGPYRLRAGGEGAAELELSPIEIYEGRESRLDQPLRLAPPLAVELVVRPATTPRDEPWYLSLAPTAGAATAWGISPQAANLEGILRQPDGVPGIYQLRVLDRFRNLWHAEEVELAPGAERIEIDLPLVEIEGLVTAGDRGVRSRLKFKRDFFGPEVSLYSGFEGELAGILPEGSWEILALLRPEGSWASVGAVEVTRPANGKPLWIAVELPETSVSGVVLDASGRPVDRGSVTASRKGSQHRAQGTTDRQGRFRLDSLLPGEYTLLARGPQRVDQDDGMARSVVTVGPGAHLDAVQLRLPGTRPVTGRVLSPHGPLPGARVLLFFDFPTRRNLARPAVTDVHGGFVMAVPEAVEVVTVLVEPAGYAARLLTLPVGEDRVLPDISVDDFGGSLTVEGIPGEGPDGRWSLRSGTTVVPLARIARPMGLAMEGARPWRIAKLAAGSYQLCRREDCTAVFVAPGAMATLTAPAPDSESPPTAP